MRTREQIIELFAPFVKLHGFTATEVLVIIDCCLGELSRKGVVSKEWTGRMNDLLREES